MTGPTIDTVRTTVYTVPTDLPEADGTASWTSTTVSVVTIACDGVTGIGWTYGPTGCASVVDDILAEIVVGRDALGVPGTWCAMQRALRNATRAGVAGYALSAVDVAGWDLKAKLVGLPLAALFGRVHDTVPVYGSGGFTTYTPDQLSEQLRTWVVDQAIPRVKIKIAQDWGGNEARDLERITLARDVVGPDCEVYVDANGGYQVKQAIRLLRAAASSNVTWFEEPVSSNDLAGLRTIRSAVDCDVAAGEYGSDICYFQRMCSAGAVDCLQIDATRCGGYTEWLRAAAVAASHELQVSGHCAPHLHAPVAAATANLRHLEWFHDHVRVEKLLFDGTLDPTGGYLTPDTGRLGHGLTVSDRAQSYRVAR